MQGDWDWVTQEMFDEVLREICRDTNPLDIPGVYELASEYHNNEILKQLAQQADVEAELQPGHLNPPHGWTAFTGTGLDVDEALWDLFASVESNSFWEQFIDVIKGLIDQPDQPEDESGQTLTLLVRIAPST